MARSRRRARRDPTPEPEVDSEPIEQEEESEEEIEQQAEPMSEDDEDRPAPTGDIVSLQFDDELTWRPGKAIPVTTLLDRLQRLAKELHAMEQDLVDLESLVTVSEALGHRNLLAHKNEGVKALSASCIADILQLSAPDAPFTNDQLKMFFTLVVSHIFPALDNSSNPYYKEHKHILRSLAETQSILLINDVDGADDLLLRLFSAFFDTISGSNSSEDGVSKEVGGLMTDMMISLIDEANGMSPKVIEVIMAQFLRAVPPGGFPTKGVPTAGQSTLLIKEEPPAYLMAKDICNQCTDKMLHYVSQYFSDVIIDASRFAAKSNGQNADADEDAPRTPTEDELKELRKAHKLIKELWRASPAVLQNVIPQIEAELSADNIDLRKIATETLGDMISGIGAAGPPPPPRMEANAYPPTKLSDDTSTQTATSILTTPLSPQSFAQTHSAAYHSFIGRNKDKTSVVRAVWTTSVGYILATSAGGIGLGREDQAELIRFLCDKLNDSDEKVRLAAVKAVELTGFRDFVLKLGPTGGISKEGSILSRLADRCRDKRPAVRDAAMTLLGNLWAVGSGEMASGNDLVSCLTGIPSVIFKAWYANDLELNLLIDRVIFECLVPITFPPIKTKGTKAASQGQSPAAEQDRIRAERILLLVKQLDPQARKAFFVMQSRQNQFALVLEAFIKQCEAYNGGVMDDNSAKKTAALEKTLSYIGQFFPDPTKVKTDYQKFAKANDRRNYQLLRFAMAPESDFKTVRGALKELFKRLEGTPHHSALDSLIPFLYRAAVLIFNKSHLSTILDYSKTDEGGYGAVAHEILHEISVTNPDMFKNFVGELCKDLVQQAPTESKRNDSNVVDILRATSAFAKKYANELPQGKDFSRALTSYALYGQPVKTAKYAIRVMLTKGQKEVTAQALFNKIMKDFEYDNQFFLNKLQCISQLYLQVPNVPAESDEEILDMTIQKIVRDVRTEASAKDPEWVEEAKMDKELHAKCLSLRIAVNRIRSLPDIDEAKAQAAPIMKLLMTFITKDGEVCKTKDTPAHHKSRLRLLAAELLLKLCTHKHLDDVLGHKDFNLLAFMTQDRESHVRRGFVEKLMKYLVHHRLRPRFYTMIFLMAFEPMTDFKMHVETWLRSRVQSLQGADNNPLLAVMGRLIPLLAHHPDYSTQVDELADHARYLLFYISHVATEKNLGLLWKYTERVKQTRDALNPEMSENLYVLSELAQAVIRKWQEKKAWTFEVYPGKVGLANGLFTALPNHDVAQGIARKQYLPEGIEEKIDDMLKSVDKKKKRKSTAEERGESGPAPKRSRTDSRAAPKKKSDRTRKAAKPKKTPSKSARSSSPIVDEASRRRSGRARNSKVTYREDEDDEEEEEDGADDLEEEGEEEEEGQEGDAQDSSDDELSDAPASPPPSSKKKTSTHKKAPSRKSAPAATGDDDDSSALSSIDGSDGEEEEEEEEEEKAHSPAPAPTKSNGRLARAAQLPSRPAVKDRPPPTKKQVAAAAKAEKEKAAAAASSSSASTRPRRGRAAAKKDTTDMDVDSE